MKAEWTMAWMKILKISFYLNKEKPHIEQNTNDLSRCGCVMFQKFPILPSNFKVSST